MLDFASRLGNSSANATKDTGNPTSSTMLGVFSPSWRFTGQLLLANPIPRNL